MTAENPPPNPADPGALETEPAGYFSVPGVAQRIARMFENRENLLTFADIERALNEGLREVERAKKHMRDQPTD